MQVTGVTYQPVTTSEIERNYVLSGPDAGNSSLESRPHKKINKFKQDRNSTFVPAVGLKENLQNFDNAYGELSKNNIENGNSAQTIENTEL